MEDPQTHHGTVRYTASDDVALITLSRPEKGNALDASLRQGLWRALRDFIADADAKVCVLAAEGHDFCVGGDLHEMTEQRLQVPPWDYLPQPLRNMECPKPIVAAVHGRAYGGGFALAQLADLVVASHDATFAITEARWGRGMPWAVPLSWLIPPRVALQLMLTGQPLDARRAYELGLVNQVVDGDQLVVAARELAATIARNAPLTLTAAKQMVYETAHSSWSEAFAKADELFEPVYRSADAIEGPQAFVERRAPRWESR